jgi:opacity protein-like surface antigen
MRQLRKILFGLVTVVVLPSATAAQTVPPPAQSPNTQARKIAKSPVAGRPWDLDAEFQLENQGRGEPNQQEFQFTLTRHLSPRLSISGGLDQHNRFDELDTQASIGAHVGLHRHNLQLSGTYTEGFGAEMTSRHEVSLKTTMLVHRRLQPSVEYTFKRYVRKIHQSSLTLGLGGRVTPRLGVLGQWLFSDSNAGKGGTAVSGGVSYGVNERLSLAGAAGYGHEHFLVKTVREVERRATALDFQGSATVHLPHHRSMKLGYEFQDRRHYYSTHVLTLNYSMSF